MFWVITVVSIVFIIDLMIYYKYNYQSIVFNYILGFMAFFGNPMSAVIAFCMIVIAIDILYIIFPDEIYDRDFYNILYILFYLIFIFLISKFQYNFLNNKASFLKYSKFCFFANIMAFFGNIVCISEIYKQLSDEYMVFIGIFYFYFIFLPYAIYLLLKLLVVFVINLIKSKENKNVRY